MLLANDSALNNREKTVSTVLGEIIWLLGQIPEYAETNLNYIVKIVFPAVFHRQFRIFYHSDEPMAVVLYAKVKSENLNRIIKDGPSCDGDWMSGDIYVPLLSATRAGDSKDFSDETFSQSGCRLMYTDFKT